MQPTATTSMEKGRREGGPTTAGGTTSRTGSTPWATGGRWAEEAEGEAVSGAAEAKGAEE